MDGLLRVPVGLNAALAAERGFSIRISQRLRNQLLVPLRLPRALFSRHGPILRCIDRDECSRVRSIVVEPAHRCTYRFYLVSVYCGARRRHEMASCA